MAGRYAGLGCGAVPMTNLPSCSVVDMLIRLLEEAAQADAKARRRGQEPPNEDGEGKCPGEKEDRS